MSKLFINKKIWNTFTDDELTKYKADVFEHFREHGFPYFDLTQLDIDKIFTKLCDFDTDNVLLENDELKQYMLGLNLANYFMPHMFEVRCQHFRSPLDCFNDDELLKIAIDKRVRYGDNMSDAGMRKALSFTNGTHKVSNFRPTIAKYIYDNYANGGTVLDFSSGYGGRLLAALASENVFNYIGFDPATKTFAGLKNMLDYVGNGTTNTFLYNYPFEDCESIVDSHSQEIDLCFSSPPYFNTERYSNEDTQSYKRYPTVHQWNTGFLEKTTDICYNKLRDNGYYIINVANTRTHETLEADTVRIAEERGFVLQHTYKMRLSSLMGKGFKYEPIFVFKKL